ncbi:MAG: hypothetical protein HC877_22625 [Thioploca sp.]|nr:hypothetical protein [Thioploca sp.]
MTLSEVLDTYITDFAFTGVYIYSDDFVYVKAIIKSLDNQEVNHTIMLRWYAGEWGQYMIPTIVPSHCVISEPKRKVLALSPDGAIHVATSQGFSWEYLDTQEDGPNSLRAVLEIKEISNSVYAVGMGRQVYKRTAQNTWVRWDNGIRGNRNIDSIGGFKSIDGYSENELYAVGFKGEIWRFDGIIWRLLDSPTNIKLEKVKCVSPDSTFICGGNGIFIKGNMDLWTVIEQDVINSTLWGIEYFKGKVYMADNSSIYTFDGKKIEKVDTRLGENLTTSYLHANDNFLWSVGERNILIYDGYEWKKVF